MTEIKLEYRGSASRGKSRVVAQLGDRVVHMDVINLASDRERTRFARAVQKALPEAPREQILELLLELATKVASTPTAHPRALPPTNHVPQTPRTADGGGGEGSDETSVSDGEGEAPVLPTFAIDEGTTHEVVDAIETLVAREEPPYFFQRGRLLVRLVFDEGEADTEVDGEMRPHAKCEAMVADAVRDSLNQRAIFTRREKELLRRVDCPKVVADWFIARDRRRVPKLRGIRHGPTLLRSGRVLTSNGYDRASHLFCDFGPIDIGAIPEKPTHEDAVRAVARLCAVLREVPFVSAEDRSTAIAFLLSLIARRCFGPCPAFAATAPSASTGKGTLFQVIVYIATGQVPTATGFGSTEEEVEKRIMAHLLEGDDLFDLDNVERPVASESLCRLITEPMFGGRLLGFSKALKFSTRNTVVALTGNNLQFVGDMRTRVALVRLDARMEQPSKRVFKGDAMREAIAHRGDLLNAALTILLAHRAAGEPPVSVVPSRFRDWSRWVQAPLVWADCADPLATTSVLQERDPSTMALLALSHAWLGAFGLRAATARDAVAAATRSKDLREAMVDAGLRTDSSGSLGKFLAENEDRIVEGRRFERAGTRSHAVLWRLVEVRQHDEGAGTAAGAIGEPNQHEAESTGPATGDAGGSVEQVVITFEDASAADDGPANQSDGTPNGREFAHDGGSKLTGSEANESPADRRGGRGTTELREFGESGPSKLTPQTHGPSGVENGLLNTAKAYPTTPREFDEFDSNAHAREKEDTHFAPARACTRTRVEEGETDSPNSPNSRTPLLDAVRDGRASPARTWRESGRDELGDWFEVAWIGPAWVSPVAASAEPLSVRDEPAQVTVRASSTAGRASLFDDSDKELIDDADPTPRSTRSGRAKRGGAS